MRERAPIRCLVADDEPLARSRLQKLLADDERFELAGFADSGSTALAFIEQHAPDVVFLDIQMPGINGLELIRQIRLIYDNYGFETEILSASIRSPMHVVESALAGADVATMPLKVITCTPSEVSKWRRCVLTNCSLECPS